MADARPLDNAPSSRLCGQVDEPSFSAAADARAGLARDFPVHVGVDCGKTFHKLVARGPDGVRRFAIRVNVSREGFADADRYLRSEFTRVPRKRVLIGLEFAGHFGETFAHFLSKLGYRVVLVQSIATKRTRELEDLSPRKDDDKDAAQICRLIAMGHFSWFLPQAESLAALRSLTTERRQLRTDAVKLRNRLRDHLAIVWPEFETVYLESTSARREPSLRHCRSPLMSEH